MTQNFTIKNLCKSISYKKNKQTNKTCILPSMLKIKKMPLKVVFQSNNFKLMAFCEVLKQLIHYFSVKINIHLLHIFFYNLLYKLEIRLHADSYHINEMKEYLKERII